LWLKHIASNRKQRCNNSVCEFLLFVVFFLWVDFEDSICLPYIWYKHKTPKGASIKEVRTKLQQIDPLSFGPCPGYVLRIMGVGSWKQGRPLPLWIFTHDTDKVEKDLMVRFFGLVFSVAPLEIFLPRPRHPCYVCLKTTLLVRADTPTLYSLISYWGLPIKDARTQGRGCPVRTFFGQRRRKMYLVRKCP